MNIETLILMTLGHALGDSVFQPTWMTKYKRIAWMELLQHSLIVSGMIFLLGSLTPLQFGVLFLTHAFIDRNWKWIIVLAKRVRFGRPTVYDQLIHFVIILVVWLSM